MGTCLESNCKTDNSGCLPSRFRSIPSCLTKITNSSIMVIRRKLVEKGGPGTDYCFTHTETTITLNKVFKIIRCSVKA